MPFPVRFWSASNNRGTHPSQSIFICNIFSAGYRALAQLMCLVSAISRIFVQQCLISIYCNFSTSILRSNLIGRPECASYPMHARPTFERIYPDINGIQRWCRDPMIFIQLRFDQRGPLHLRLKMLYDYTELALFYFLWEMRKWSIPMTAKRVTSTVLAPRGRLPLERRKWGTGDAADGGRTLSVRGSVVLPSSPA